jgi:acetyl esterase/lipase
VHKPSSEGGGPHPALLWIHGGGYVLGHPVQEDRLAQLYADGLGAIVAVPDYRLAPEHPFPAGLHDCHDALVSLAARDDVDAGRIAIGGASAGGGLAAALALLARERAEVRPVFQLLVYPMLDDRTTMRPQPDPGRFRIWDQRSNRWGWEAYLGRPPGAADIDPLAAPARAEDLAGLPPAWIGVGSFDLFHDEDLAYAERLDAAGVPCEVHVVDGAYHGFDALRWASPVSRSFRDAQMAALRPVLRPEH